MGYVYTESTAEKGAAANSFTNIPEAADDLHSAVSEFDEFYNHIIEGISKKPLAELLAESGYATASSLPSTPADPTLPQNRPNQTSNNAATEASSAVSESQINSSPTSHRQQSAVNAGDPASRKPKLTLSSKSPAHTERPNVAESQSTTSHPLGTPKPPPTPLTLETASLWHHYFTTRPPNEQELRRYVYLDYIEAEGEQRGGPGRVSYEEFVESVDGKERGELEFVWRWIDLGLF